MIGYLSGSIIDLIPDEKNVILFVQGVGYRIKVNTDCLSRLKMDQKIQLFIHTAVREDDISLYGFETREEYEFFKQLISVSGVGPKIALDVLSVPLLLTQNAILQEDTGLLTKIKGVGKKTAERIVLELKGKVVPAKLQSGGQEAYAYNEDALLALQGLGYEKMHILKVFAEIPKNLQKTEDMVKYFLKNAS